MQMDLEIFKGLILNIGLLVVIAQILARVRLVKENIVQENHKLRDRLALIIIFSGIGILSTHTGYSVQGAIANTRVIGVMAGGFIGGPIVGIGAGIISGLHRYLIDIDGFSALACAFSTMIEGFLAASTSNMVRKNKYKSSDLFFITFIAEITQMIIILIVAKPYSEAIDLVSKIAIPMTIFNPLGMVLFVGAFNLIFKEKEYEIGNKLSLAFDITKKCLPLLRSGLYDKENCNEIGKIILGYSKNVAILFTDSNSIISISGKKTSQYIKSSELPKLSAKIIDEKKLCVTEDAEVGDSLYYALKDMVAIGTPLSMNGQIFGTMILFVHKYKLSFHSEIKFVEGLGKLFSVQYELSESEKQRELLQKAEFNALQTQINPHFIFNSLNTISAFCREKPEKARDLLIDLATYFRNSIQTEDGFISIYDEMEYVEAYLQLEKARFEDRLHIIIELPDNIDCMMPCLILQPIVENAVKHGAMKRKIGIVQILIEDKESYVKISIYDNGLGMPPEILEQLEKNTIDSSKIGLFNVHRRLQYIYGKENGLNIEASKNGTKIVIKIPHPNQINSFNWKTFTKPLKQANK